ncbi:MAG: hypothetical protein ACXACI_13690 [Candidatus Hodarchaeales archaeon]
MARARFVIIAMDQDVDHQQLRILERLFLGNLLCGYAQTPEALEEIILTKSQLPDPNALLQSSKYQAALQAMQKGKMIFAGHVRWGKDNETPYYPEGIIAAHGFVDLAEDSAYESILTQVIEGNHLWELKRFFLLAGPPITPDEWEHQRGKICILDLRFPFASDIFHTWIITTEAELDALQKEWEYFGWFDRIEEEAMRWNLSVGKNVVIMGTLEDDFGETTPYWHLGWDFFGAWLTEHAARQLDKEEGVYNVRGATI